MRKTHKNLIFECLTKTPYGIDSFDIVDSDESNTAIYFGDTQFKFQIDVEDLDVNDTSNFSNDDQYQIQLAVQDLKLLIPAKFSLTNEQLFMVNKKLDYLVEASGRVTKTDWKGLLISMIFSIIVALSLDREMGHQLWELIMQVFKNIRLLSN